MASNNKEWSVGEVVINLWYRLGEVCYSGKTAFSILLCYAVIGALFGEKYTLIYSLFLIGAIIYTHIGRYDHGKLYKNCQ